MLVWLGTCPFDSVVGKGYFIVKFDFRSLTGSLKFTLLGMKEDCYGNNLEQKLEGSSEVSDHENTHFTGLVTFTPLECIIVGL